MYANMIDMGHALGSDGVKYPMAYEINTRRLMRGYNTPDGIQYVAIKEI